MWNYINSLIRMHFLSFLVEITNKMQPCVRIYYCTFHWRLNMFRAAYRLALGALTEVPTQTWLRPVTTCVCKPEAGNRVRASDDGAVYRSKYVEPLMIGEIINSVTRLHLVGYFYWIIASNVLMQGLMMVLSTATCCLFHPVVYVEYDWFWEHIFLQLKTKGWRVVWK